LTWNPYESVKKNNKKVRLDTLGHKFGGKSLKRLFLEQQEANKNPNLLNFQYLAALRRGTWVSWWTTG